MSDQDKHRTEIGPATMAAIMRKKSMYGRYIDTKQWDKFSEVALPDAELNFYGTDGAFLTVGKMVLAFRSAETFVNFFKAFFAKAQTLHMFGPGELTQIHPDEVRAVWAMEDEIILPMSVGLIEVRGGGYYHEIWKRKDGDWFLKSLNLHRTYTKTSFWAWVLLLLQKYLGVYMY